ncbi:MAG: hypothetical protein K2M55_04585, partial [Muribaculaceae bacterium]|nr:hypothetical protein [Muribaculaceae bacterium]
TDDDPENYWEATGLAQVTVAFSEFLRFVHNTDFQGERMSVKSGDRFGFVLASDGAAFDVLALDLVKMFCFNFYKDGSLVKTVNASHDNLDVLGLGLINVQLGDKGQQVSIDVPYIDGEEEEFDGIGLSVAGVDANVVNQLRVKYAYIDCFEEVPLIKKYFPHLTSKSDGMTTGAQYLIDNNLANGASTAVLNIGGAYYTVMNDEPFPGGIEFGFHITEGTVLDLDLGKAMKIAALTYPLDANGNYDLTQAPIEISETNVNINVVGLNLVGGGQSVVCSIQTPGIPFFGIKLSVIKGVSVELGATVYHYAYVKLPKVPEINMPFLTSFHVVPMSTFDVSEANSTVSIIGGTNKLRDGYVKNVNKNTFLMDNSEEKPLTTTNDYWSDHTRPSFSQFAKDKGNTKNLSMTLARRAIYDDGSEDGFDAVAYLVFHQKTTDNGIFDKAYNGNPVVELHPVGSKNTEYTYLDFVEGTDDVFDLSNIVLGMPDLERHFGYDAEKEKHAIAFEYALYLPFQNNKDLDEADMKNFEEATQLATDFVVIPTVKPTYEMAGVYTHDDVKSDQNPADAMEMGKYGNYLIIDMPEFLDEKVRIESVDLYQYEAFESQPPLSALWYDFSRVNDLKRHYSFVPAATDGKSIAHVVLPGLSKVIVDVDDDTRDYVEVSSKNDTESTKRRMDGLKTVKYFVVANLKYTDEFIKQIEGGHANMSNMAAETIRYAFVATATPKHEVPVLEYDGLETYIQQYSQEHVHVSKMSVRGLEAFAENHTAFSETNPIHFTQWWKTSAAAARAQVAARAPEVTDWTNSVNHNAGTTIHSGVEDATYNEDGTHTANVVSETPATKDSYLLDLHTRAYMAVRPSGLAADDIEPSYVALEAPQQALVEVDDNTQTGVADVSVEDIDAKAEFFNLEGQPVANPGTGVFLMRKGDTVTKVALH